METKVTIKREKDGIAVRNDRGMEWKFCLSEKLSTSGISGIAFAAQTLLTSTLAHFIDTELTDANELTFKLSFTQKITK